jgi:hypothetical protein
MPTTLLWAARFCGLRACVCRCPTSSLLLSAATVHVGVKQRVDDFSKYLYLTRVKNAQVILDAIQDGVARLTWKHDTFAYADSHDSAANRYRGLETGRRPNVQLNSESVVVKPDVASAQIEKVLRRLASGMAMYVRQTFLDYSRQLLLTAPEISGYSNAAHC